MTLSAHTLPRGGDPHTTEGIMPKVCVFSPDAAPQIEDWSADVPARISRNGAEYQAHRLSRLVSTREVDEIIVYIRDPLSPREEIALFNALYPSCGGIFQLVPLPQH
jgi:hypothetical protein